MEPVVGDAFVDDAVHRRGLHLAAERRRKGGPRIVDENDQNVRRIGRKPARRHALLVDRLLHRAPGDAGRRRRRERKGLLFFRFIFRVSHPSSPILTNGTRCAHASISADDPTAIRAARGPSCEFEPAETRRLVVGVVRLGRQFRHQDGGADEHDKGRPCPGIRAKPLSGTVGSGATYAFSRSPLPHLSCPFIGPILKGGKGSTPLLQSPIQAGDKCNVRFAPLSLAPEHHERQIGLRDASGAGNER